MSSRSLEGDPEFILLVSVMVSAVIVCFRTLFAVACRYNAVRGALQLARGNSWHLKSSIYIMCLTSRSQLTSSVTLTWPLFSFTSCDLRSSSSGHLLGRLGSNYGITTPYGGF
jgi:hypothetical protein